MLSRKIPGLALLALSAMADSARADVLVVDFTNGPGSDYAVLFEALDAAQDGDVLLVRPGNYDAWTTIDGRSLTVVADGANVKVTGTLTVRNLAQGQRVVLRGLTVGYPGSVELFDNDGVVYVEDCTILADQQGGAGENAGLLAVESRVVLSGSAVAGSLNYGVHETPPTPGLLAIRSEVVLTNSGVHGGDGTDPYGPSVPGAAGLWLDDSSVLAQGSTVTGGIGDTATGGTGLVALNGSSLHLLASDVAGGIGTPRGDAQAVDGGSTLIALPGTAHALASTSPAREGQLAAVTMQGSPGDADWLALSLAPGWQPAGNGHLVLVVGLPFQLIPLGSSGQAALPFTVPDLPAGLPAVDVLLQDLYVEAGSGLKLAGPATVLTLLDAAY